MNGVNEPIVQKKGCSNTISSCLFKIYIGH